MNHGPPAPSTMANSRQSLPFCLGEWIHYQHENPSPSLPSRPCHADCADRRASPDADNTGRGCSRKFNTVVAFKGAALLLPLPCRGLLLPLIVPLVAVDAFREIVSSFSRLLSHFEKVP